MSTFRKNNGELERIEPANSDTPILRSFEVEGEIDIEVDCRGLTKEGYCIPLQFSVREIGCVPSCSSYRRPLNLYVNRECYEEQ